jgi:hypothetical protein
MKTLLIVIFLSQGYSATTNIYERRFQNEERCFAAMETILANPIPRTHITAMCVSP